MSKPFIDVTLVVGKETKNTYRYDEEPQAGQPPKVGTQYIQKWALPSPPPQRIKLTVEAV